MIDQEELEKLLKELWENDESVPASIHYRTTELDWFSAGIKDNIVACIAVKVLGMERALTVLEQDNINKENQW